jgi:hypothetical protein
MAYKNAAPAGKGGRRAPLKSGKATRTTGNGSSPRQSDTSAAPKLDDCLQFDCHLCGGEADATYKEWPRGSGWVDWQIGCFRHECRDNREYLPTLAETLGLPTFSTKDEIVDSLRVTDRVRTRYRRGGAPESLTLAEMRVPTLSTLLFEPDGRRALRYLTRDRGLTLEVIQAAKLGWNGTTVSFPMFKDGRLIAIKRVRPQPGAKLRKPEHSSVWDWPLYPEAQRDAQRTFLVEGEWDALRLRSVGIPAVSVTGGQAQWRDEWAEELMGRRVVVAYDVEFETRTEQVAQSLRDAGVPARAFDLRRLGLTGRNEDLSDYLDRGGSVAALRRALAPRVNNTKNSKIVSLNRSSAGRGNGHR